MAERRITRVKICGITSVDDARMVIDAGADAIGLVFAGSKRRIDVDTARAIVRCVPPFVAVVGVFMDAPVEEVLAIASAVGCDTVQLHGNEDPAYCRRVVAAGYRVIKRIRVHDADTPAELRVRMEPYRVHGFLLDPGAGDGRLFAWSVARGLTGPIIVAGGLTPANVQDVLRVLRPYAVDVSSGVERAPGKKDPEKVRAFLRAVRQYDATVLAG